MIRKGIVSGLVLLVLLSGCGLRNRDPQPRETQTSVLNQLSAGLTDLEVFQSNQDDLTDDDLVGE